MSSTEIPILVLCGDGINCERETALAFEVAGGRPHILHVNDLLAAPERLHDFRGMAFPGGFSFGDDLGAGLVLGLKLREKMGDHLRRFMAAEKPIIGICNGFQVLSKLGLLPDFSGPRSMALAPNIQGTFIDRWVKLDVHPKSICKWTVGLTELELPVRHGEGRVVFRRGQADAIFAALEARGQIVLQYQEDINGSYAKIAGICDPTGLVLGLMPHPEAYLFQGTRRTLSSEPALSPGEGQALFRNILNHLRPAA